MEVSQQPAKKQPVRTREIARIGVTKLREPAPERMERLRKSAGAMPL